MGNCCTNYNKKKRPLGYLPLIGQSHEIILTLKITSQDTYKDTNVIGNFYDHFNSGNVKIFIENKEVEFNKYFKPRFEGLYTIKIKIFVELLDCSFMFHQCNKIINIDLSNFRTDQVTNMESMFEGCDSLINIKFGSFDTKNVKNMEAMFLSCFSLRTLDLSSFDTSKVTNMRRMFSGCFNI